MIHFIRKAIKIFDTKKRFSYLDSLGLYSGLSDEEYIRKKYKVEFDRDIDLENPKFFNEKLQRLKLDDRKSI